MPWLEVQKQFEINNNAIWLNNCGVSAAGKFSIAAVQEFLNEFSSFNYRSEHTSVDKIYSEIKSFLAELLNANAEDFTLVHNTCEVMNFVSYGLDLKAGDEIVLVENEYPSNVYPWQHWQEKGVKIRIAAMPLDTKSFQDNIFKTLNQALAECQGQIILSLSPVHWLTGAVMPLETLTYFCQKNDIFFCIDGAQLVGHKKLDLSIIQPDVMGFSAWKWLLGPLGLGVMYMPKGKLDKIKPIFMGTSSVVNDLDYFPYRSELKATVERYNYSTPSYIDWAYFHASLKFLKEIGFEKVQDRIIELADYLEGGLVKAGFQVIRNREATGIVVFSSEKLSSEKIVEFLLENKIESSLRGDRVRFSVHILNDKKQLDQVISTLTVIE